MINEHFRHWTHWELLVFFLFFVGKSSLWKREWNYFSSNLFLRKRCALVLKNWEVCFFFFLVLGWPVWWGPDTNIWALHTLQLVFVQIDKCICSNWQMYLSKITIIFFSNLVGQFGEPDTNIWAVHTSTWIVLLRLIKKMTKMIGGVLTDHHNNG